MFWVLVQCSGYLWKIGILSAILPVMKENGENNMKKETVEEREVGSRYRVFQQVQNKMKE
jgi:hypothetical protein